MAIQMGFEPGDFDLRTMRAAAAEFVATGLFVFIGAGSVVMALNVTSGDGPAFITAIALAHGLAIAVLVAAIARISGGHINPAVTFAAAITGKMKVSTAVLYLAAQVTAAVLGALLLKGVIAGPFEAGLGAHGLDGFGIGLLEDQAGDGAGAGLLVEAVLTFALVFVIFATAMDPKGMTHLAPAAIGLTVAVDHFIGVPLTGASMNPARSFGPAIVANIWDDHWVYWLGPLIGGGVAALVYEYVFMRHGDDDEALSAPSPPPEAGA